RRFIRGHDFSTFNRERAARAMIRPNNTRTRPWWMRAPTFPGSNDEGERRGGAVPESEADLSQSSIPCLAQRRRGPRSLEPIVRAAPTSTLGAADHAEPTI